MTIGDPRPAPLNKGGEVGNNNPSMRNVEAAAFVNNITRSIEGFASVPANVANVGMPGEYIATLLIPVAAQERVQSELDPTDWIANPDFVPSLQNYLLTGLNPPSVLANPIFDNGNFGSVTLNGQNPFRTTGQTYSDGVTGSSTHYLSQGGEQLAYNSATRSRNRIAGDFNGDGLRNVNDIADMLPALGSPQRRARLGGPAGTGRHRRSPGTDASIEILGDFNADATYVHLERHNLRPRRRRHPLLRRWLAIDPATGTLEPHDGLRRGRRPVGQRAHRLLQLLRHRPGHAKVLPDR